MSGVNREEPETVGAGRQLLSTCTTGKRTKFPIFSSRSPGTLDLTEEEVVQIEAAGDVEP